MFYRAEGHRTHTHTLRHTHRGQESSGLQSSTRAVSSSVFHLMTHSFVSVSLSTLLSLSLLYALQWISASLLPPLLSLFLSLSRDISFIERMSLIKNDLQQLQTFWLYSLCMCVCETNTSLSFSSLSLKLLLLVEKKSLELLVFPSQWFTVCVFSHLALTCQQQCVIN